MPPTPDVFASILMGILAAEGGYTNNPNDKGGETNWGITVAVAREFGYTGDMKAMPREVAENIYRAKFWVLPGFDKVAEVSPLIARKLADTGVNMGPGVPSKWLQEWLTALNRQGKDFPDLTPDGAIGPKTIAALRAYLNKRGPAGEVVLLRGLNCSQGVRYLEITESRPANEDFIYGWLANRVG